MNSGRVAIGLRAHSGWAAMVALLESSGEITIVDRRRINLADPQVPGFPQPYHAAAEAPAGRARQLVDGCVAACRRLAGEGIRLAVEDLSLRGLKVVACGVLTGSGRALPAFEAILASHPMLHTAEGEMFREALLDGAARCGLATRTLKERDAYMRAAAALGIAPSEMRGCVQALGASIGPPWREDQKLAAAAAWRALRQA